MRRNLVPYIDINNYEDVEVKFTQSNIDSIYSEFKRINDVSKKYSNEEMKKFEDALAMLGNFLGGFQLEAYIDDLYVDEDVLKDDKGSYDDGYNDAIETIENSNKQFMQTYGCLLQKIERLANGYGNQESLTKEEIKVISDVLASRV